MKIIIPLGGFGKRFQDCGYSRPKPLVRVLGKELIFWVLDSLKLTQGDELYIPYNERLSQYKFEEIVKIKHPQLHTFAIQDTRGASETIKMCVDHFGIKGRVAILDGDTWYENDILAGVRDRPGNLVAHFNSTAPDAIYSYIRTDGEFVQEIREKEKISDMASSGCYVFDEAEEFSRVVSNMNLGGGGETYTSQVISKMIEEGFKFRTFMVENFHILGTPEQIIKFSKSHKTSSKRFCFDLDNTLVTSPRTPGDYSTVEPISDTINYLKSLKRQGHTIIIYTARRMRTHCGNIGAVMSDISQVTMETLERFGIPHDEVYFGKPYAHFYVDDLMVDPRSDMNKELGFYMEDVKPRRFNKVEKGKTFHKTSTNEKKITAEAFYHEWVKNKCSIEIQKIFPQIIASGDGWLETELVDGLDFSTLYLNQVLKPDSLNKLLNCLDKLHKIKEGEGLVFSYENFGKKFNERIRMYDHAKYGMANKVAEEISLRLDEIASEGFRRVMIHGDPVFSNVLLDGEGNIKMVDMRGVEGDNFTVFGHPLYDFAKVYQSICGYDEILLEKRVDLSYKKSIKKTFEERFDNNELNKIRLITVSLLLSLIPLHDEESKCKKYAELALGMI